MSPRPPKGPRLYTRQQGGELRYYADLRSRGGGRVALVPDGETQATTDPEIAAKLLADLLEQLREEKRDRALLGVKRRATLQAFVSDHLVKKAKSARVGEAHLASSEAKLIAAIEFFGPDRDLASIGVEHVQDYAHWLARRSNGRRGTLSSTTQAHYLTALSNLFRRAQAEGLIRGVNPVGALMDKPQVRPAEAPWLEVWEGALLLEAARTFPYEPPVTSTVGERLDVALRASIGFGGEAEAVFVDRMRAAGTAATSEKLRAYLSGHRIPTRSYVEAAERVLGLAPGELRRDRGWSAGSRPAPLFHPLIATFLLTGGRVAEVLGLELGEVSLPRETVTFRPNRRRRLKTRSSRRVVPLWPQLREVLEPYLEARRSAGAGESDLLFPSPVTGEMIVNLRPGLDAIAQRAGWGAGEIRPKAFRHTYASARLQTLEHGHPVAERTVAGELGHGGFEMVRRVYGHLGTIRHRSEVVEYRVEQHRGSIPGERLRGLLRLA